MTSVRLVFVSLLGIAILFSTFVVSCQGERDSPPGDEGFSIGSARGGICSQGALKACYGATVSATGARLCHEGVQECLSDGTWDTCELPIDPSKVAIIGDPELCGGCDPACFATLDRPVDGETTGDNSGAVRYDEAADGLVLDPFSSGGGRHAYIANSPDSTVSKVALEDYNDHGTVVTAGDEVGRYLVGNPGKRCGCWCDGCNHPSRTAVDSQGNGYVASRAFGGQGSVTKIAGERSECRDRDGNFALDTSSGAADLLAWGADECVLWTKMVGETDCIPCDNPSCALDPNDCDWGLDPDCAPCGATGCSADPSCTRSGVPRALAFDKIGRLWVGMSQERRFYVLDASSGDVLDTVDVDLRPYGAAVGRDGLLWFTDGCCERRPIQSIDTVEMTKGQVFENRGTCEGSYGITVDFQNRVIIGGYPNNCISRFDHNLGDTVEAWEGIEVGHSTGGVRGVTIDAEGRYWGTQSRNKNAMGPHFLVRFLEGGPPHDWYTIHGCGVPIGLAPDFAENVWAVCQRSNNLARIDVTGAHSADVDHFPVGPSPYTYSDFTGFHRATITAPEGHYTRLHDSAVVCTDDTNVLWSQLYFDVETPASTSIEFWSRTANDIIGIASATKVLLGIVPAATSPIEISGLLSDLGLTHDRYFEVNVVLKTTEFTATPVFRSMQLVQYCECSCDVDASCSADCECDRQCGS